MMLTSRSNCTGLAKATAILASMAMRGSTPGLLFRFQDDHLQALVGCGLDPTKYAGHSFRIGAATSAASKGINDSTIKTSRKMAYQIYIRTPLASFSAVLGANPDKEQ